MILYETKKAKDGKYSKAEAEAIIGLCYLAEATEEYSVSVYGRQRWPGYGEYGEPCLHDERRQRKIRAWVNPAGLYVEAA